jgi:ATP adenylyltransferase
MTQLLPSGSLWAQIRSCTQSAIAKGALHTIATDLHTLQQDGFEFIIRVAQNLKRKAADTPFNPFLPPEPELTVADITPTHLAVLNKFNVVENHLLIVTRDFEHQEHLLTLEDFNALWTCLGEYPSLGFYNGGTQAGASQPHKHLQLVPLPLYQGHSGIPFDPIYDHAPRITGPHHLEQLPFRHCWSALPVGLVEDPSSAAGLTRSLYLKMLKSVGIDSLKDTDGEYQSAPYNLLMTRDWMLLVPRAQESYQGISINSLGYAGSLFVKDQIDVDKVKRMGPIHLLKMVSICGYESDLG